MEVKDGKKRTRMQQQYIFAPVYFIGRRMRFVFLSRFLNCFKTKMKFLKYSKQTEIYWYLVFAWGLENFPALPCSISLQFKHSLDSPKKRKGKRSEFTEIDTDVKQRKLFLGELIFPFALLKEADAAKPKSPHIHTEWWGSLGTR